eukprot:CAMPEP_0198266796 /NCGR_PEP_ID=MMETSP1447-20131203/30155_1 /TAXON_ID=420782 /ORGANISM="Chaetoceros dichaeta, Strain CCMP1751" /LENGTH=997 /DNA_ID=CAMNT_0043957061 /DNA_START=377 /DNA_END=3370 /DNA_ORIENTATION=-
MVMIVVLSALLVSIADAYTTSSNGIHLQRQQFQIPATRHHHGRLTISSSSSSLSSGPFVGRGDGSYDKDSFRLSSGGGSASGWGSTGMKMGLFSSSHSGSGKSRSSSLRGFAASNMRRILNVKRMPGNNIIKPRLQIGRHAMINLLSKSRVHLKSLRHVCRSKYRSCTLAAATTLFATTMFSATLTNSPSPLVQQQHQHQQSSVSMSAASTSTSSSVQRHLVTSLNRGGEGISASRPSDGMRRVASAASVSGQHRPFQMNRNTDLINTNTKTSLLKKTTPTPTSRMPMANISLRRKAPAATSTDIDPTALAKETKQTFKAALNDLQAFMQGAKSDTLLLLLATSLVTPLCKKLGTSPILGFLAAGMVLGPNALGLISGIHSTETLAELGIVFFLFEMGIELSFERLKSMRKDVFGLGLSQFAVTAVVLAAVGSLFSIPANALVVLGGGLALSSSAFVLQLLKDNNQLATRFGKASFGVLLFQDLAVVPLLVVTPILAGGGTGLASALGSALIKAAMALTSIAFAGRVILNPLFKTVANSNSQEAFLGVILLTVLSMSFMTEGLGLSNTLGAFLAGVLLSETKYRYQIEADIAPFRGILLGLFFVTVGFEIDFHLISNNLPLVSSIVATIILVKTTVTTLLSLAFGLSLSTAQQTGLMLCQGGEFAFVAFGLARNLGILDPAMTKLMLTSVALTMAVTPMLANVGGKISKRLEENSDFSHYLGQDRDAAEIKDSEDFVVVVGYGAVGKVVCDLLDKKLYRYVGLELNPNKAIQARNKGLPVFYGDIGRPEVAEAFNVGSARAVIVTIADKDQANRAVIALRRTFPEIKIFARAKDADHAERLQRTLDVIAMVPVVPEDNVLLTLPFGGAVLRSLGAAQEEVNAILEGTRKEILAGRGTTGDEEEKMVLTQLGILTESMEEMSTSSSASSSTGAGGEGGEKEEVEESSSEVARAAADASKPMVAEVIKAAAGKVDKTPQVVDVEVIPDTKDTEVEEEAA